MHFFLKTTVTILTAVIITLWLILQDWPDHHTHLVFCDVGQGDATLISKGFFQILVDGGPGKSVLSCLDDHLPFWDTTIEVVIATHADKDHIAGLTHVLDRYQIQKMLLTPWGKNTAVFTDFRTAVLREVEQGAIVSYPQQGDQLTLADAFVIHILFPEGSEDAVSAFGADFSETQLSDVIAAHEAIITNYNDRSIVFLLEVDQISFLLTGDLEEEGEQALLTKGLTTKTNLLKVGHHGSKTSTSQEFIQRVRPEISVISSGKNNQFGHPAPLIVARLQAIGSRILRTDELGAIEVVTDGQKLWWVR